MGYPPPLYQEAKERLGVGDGGRLPPAGIVTTAADFVNEAKDLGKLLI